MSIIEITALDDPRLSDFGHHTDVYLRNSTGGTGLYIAESLLVLERALAAGHEPRSVLALGTSASDAVALIGDRCIPVFTGPGELLAELTGYALHRGVIAAMHRPVQPSIETVLMDARRIVVLEDVVDPTNVGAIFRSAAAIGADAILVTPRCSDPFYRRAIRVSMGTVLQVPWARAPGWSADVKSAAGISMGGAGAGQAGGAGVAGAGQAGGAGATPDEAGSPGLRQLLHASGFHIAALALAPDALDLREFAASAPDRVALVLGTEGGGLTDEAIAAADTVVRIPMRHGIDSLNVAATAAVAMWALAAG